jgi:hypothetical protein
MLGFVINLIEAVAVFSDRKNADMQRQVPVPVPVPVPVCARVTHVVTKTHRSTKWQGGSDGSCKTEENLRITVGSGNDEVQSRILLLLCIWLDLPSDTGLETGHPDSVLSTLYK